MVNIIINDENNMDYQELLSVLDKVVEDNKKLEEIILQLIGKINHLDDNVNRVYNKLENIQESSRNTDYESIVEALEKMNTGKVDVKESNVKKESKTGNRKIIKKTKPKASVPKKTTTSKGKARGKAVKDTDVFVPNKAMCKAWKNLQLNKDGSIINKGRKTFILPVDLNLLLYLIECDSPYMIRRDSKKLQEEFNVNIGTWGKIVYNIRAKKFNKIIKEYKQRLDRVQFSVNEENFLLIDGKNTKIHKNLVYDWIQLMVNTNKKESKILEIQKAYPNFDKYIVRMVCDSYDNSVLNGLVEKPKVERMIENNPSKRRNLIQNGGLL